MPLRVPVMVSMASPVGTLPVMLKLVKFVVVGVKLYMVPTVAIVAGVPLIVGKSGSEPLNTPPPYVPA
jgi:hypothetical protein